MVQIPSRRGTVPAFSWRCPHCEHDAVIRNDDTATTYEWARGAAVYAQFVWCPNPECGRYTLTVDVYETVAATDSQPSHLGRLLRSVCLVPPSRAEIWPDYVPAAIRQDYVEACGIVEESAKAAATLARRCLQGMIRDFWEVDGRRTLYEEIEAIADKVDATTLASIHAIRDVGNIGAHMERDVNLIIDVEPGEAEALISLIEVLVRDWYIAKHEREERLQAVVEVAAAKSAERHGQAESSG